MTDRVDVADQRPWLEAMGAFVAGVVMCVYAFTVVAPYFFHATDAPAVLELIKNNKSTVDLITTAVVMFYFGASVGRRKDQDNVSALVHTNAVAQAALAPVAGAEGAVVPIAPGETKKIVGTTEG